MVIDRICRVSNGKQHRNNFVFGRAKKKRRREPPKQRHRLPKWRQKLTADRTHKVPVTITLPRVLFLERKPPE